MSLKRLEVRRLGEGVELFERFVDAGDLPLLPAEMSLADDAVFVDDEEAGTLAE